MAGEKGNTFSNQFLLLTFNGTAIPGLAMNTTTSPLTTFYVSLHTADPTAGGTQSSSEVAYTGYARVAVARTTSGWVVTNQTVNPAANIVFPSGTGGSGTATYWGVGTAATGTGELLYAGPLNPSVVCGSGVTPTMTTATNITEG